MIWKLLTTKVSGWWLLAILVVALLFLILQAEHADDTANQARGAASQRAEDLQTTLERTEDAHAARTEIRDDRGAARHGQCLRTARTPENCQRFLPVGPADQR